MGIQVSFKWTMSFYGTCFLGFAKIFRVWTFLRVRGEFVGWKCLRNIETSYFQRGFVICRRSLVELVRYCIFSATVERGNYLLICAVTVR